MPCYTKMVVLQWLRYCKIGLPCGTLNLNNRKPQNLNAEVKPLAQAQHVYLDAQNVLRVVLKHEAHVQLIFFCL